MNWILSFAVEEEDIFQCGKCKRKFTNLSQFFGHKQNQCIPAVQSSNPASDSISNVAHVCNSGITNTNVVYTAQLPNSHCNQQIAVISWLPYYM